MDVLQGIEGCSVCGMLCKTNYRKNHYETIRKPAFLARFTALDFFFLNIIVINFSQSRNYFSSSSSPREVQRDSLIYLVVFFIFALNFLKDSELDENPEDVEATTHFGAPGMGR